MKASAEWVRAPRWVDDWLPQLGPCRVCESGADQRHRILDAIADRVRAGDSAYDVGIDYRLPEAYVQRVADEWQENWT
ncbi:MAG: hypothetical protein J2P57_19860 [Acidimicrobiaceae bacterium]|nr:hypothetical protein [Acidimicrobiaceae bacterium]